MGQLSKKQCFLIIAGILWAVAVSMFLYSYLVVNTMLGFLFSGIAFGIASTQTYDAFRMSEFAGKVYIREGGIIKEVEI